MGPFKLAWIATNMKKTIYFHIGMYKTGTSFLQKFFKMNAQKLAKNNIYYSTTGRSHDGSHYDLYKAATRFEFDKQMRNDLEKEIAGCNCDNVLISMEHLVNGCGDERFVKKLLSPFANSDVKIIIYFRRQDKYLESLYNQEAKQWFSGSIEDYYEQVIKDNNEIDAHRLDYYNITTRLAENIGKENLIIKAFEPDGSENWLLHSFFQIFGLVNFADYAIPQFGNESLKRETILFLNKLGDKDSKNAFKQFVGWQNPQVLEFINNILAINDCISGSKGYFMSPQRRKELCLFYAVGNSQIAREFLGREDGRLFLEPLPDETEVWQDPGELSIKTMVEIFAALQIKQLELSAKPQKTREVYRSQLATIKSEVLQRTIVGLRSLFHQMKAFQAKWLS